MIERLNRMLAAGDTARNNMILFGESIYTRRLTIMLACYTEPIVNDRGQIENRGTSL